jgi:hypothetical protein
MRSGERIVQKARRGFRPGFIHDFQIAVSYTSPVTRVKRHFEIVYAFRRKR